MVSFASLIFAGDLAPFLAQSIGFILLGSVLLGLVIALFTSLPGTVGGTQDVAAAVLAVIAASVARTMPAGPGRAGFSHPALIKLFPSLDRGLEWCETQLLQASVDQEAEDATQPLQQELAAVLGSAHTAQRLLAYLESRPVQAGEYLIRQGEEAYEMYFVESGQLTAQIEVAGQEPVRLQMMRGGHVVGELAFFLQQPRTAAVVADEPTTAYCLSQATLSRMQQQDEALALALQQLTIHLLAERVVHLVNVVDALQS